MKLRRLGDVCVYDRRQQVHRGLPYVGMEHVESDTGRFIGAADALEVKSNTFHFTPSHVLYGRLRPYLNKVFAPDFEGHCSTEIFPLLPSPELSREYLRYWISSNEICDRINGTCTGARMPRANMDAVLDFEIPLPPLPEQRRIVGILDEAFAAIATAKANAERNLRNAGSIFDSFLESAFTARDSTWTDHGRPLAELCELIVDCEHKTAPTQDDGFPSIRTPNIGKGQLLLEGVYRVSEKTYREWTRRAEPRAGDLILGREAPAGNVAVIPDNLRVCLGQRTVLIRPNTSIFDPKFLAFDLLRPQVQQRLLAHSRGATVQHVNMKDIRALRLGAVPPLEKQRAIVARVGRGALEGKHLECLYQQKLAALDALKKSLLHQAFSGQLLG